MPPRGPGGRPRRAAERPPRDHRHPARGPRRLLRSRLGLDPRARRPGRPRRPVRDGDRPRAPHGALPRLDSHGTGPPRPRVPGERRLRPARPGEIGGRGLPPGRLPDGGLRLGLPPRPPLRLRPWLRNLRRPPAEGERPPPDAVCRAPRRRHHRGRAPLARPDCGARRRAAAPVLPLGPLLRPPRAVRAPGRLRRTLPGRPLRRRGGVRRPAARAAPPRARGAGRPRPHARRRDVGPRRGPGRARRGHPRPLRLRLDAQGALHRGRPWHRWWTHGADRRPRHRRAAVSPGLRRPPAAPRDRGAIAPPGDRGAGDERRPGLRRDALPAARVRVGAALCLAHRAAQDDRGPAPRALRPRDGPGRDREPRGKRERAPRRDAAEAGGGALAHGPLGRGRGRPRGRGAAARPGLRGRRRRGPGRSRGPLSATPRTASAWCRGSTAACRWCAPTPRRRSAT